MTAILLVCALAVTPADCTEKTAVDSVPVAVDGVVCGPAAQAVIASTQLVDDKTYLKVVCK
jgi:hypothetical protein